MWATCPRTGIVGKDHDDDVVECIVVMGRTFHTRMSCRESHRGRQDEPRRHLPPGSRSCPSTTAWPWSGVTTHTVLHNLIFGCLLVFFIQWIFLGDLRSAIIVGVNIPFALFFSIIMLVLQGEDANLLSVGAVDFGIIVDSAVILVENIFRNFRLRRDDQDQI
jgi:cobalt-zinc-cadmium resistance protein CzcA